MKSAERARDKNVYVMVCDHKDIGQICSACCFDLVERARAEARKAEREDWRSIQVTKGGESHPLGRLVDLLEFQVKQARAERDKLRVALKPFADQGTDFHFHINEPYGPACVYCGDPYPCMWIKAKEALEGKP